MFGVSAVARLPAMPAVQTKQAGLRRCAMVESWHARPQLAVAGNEMPMTQFISGGSHKVERCYHSQCPASKDSVDALADTTKEMKGNHQTSTCSESCSWLKG